jgi:hypothetical protein
MVSTRLAMVVAHFTRFVRESSELFRLIPGRLRRHAVFFRKPTVLLGILTAVDGVRGHVHCLLGLPSRRNLVVVHGIHSPAAYQLRRTRDVLKRTLRWSCVSNVSAARDRNPVSCSAQPSAVPRHTLSGIGGVWHQPHSGRRHHGPLLPRGSTTAQSLSPVEHDHQFLKLRLTDAERGDLIEYSKSL